MKKLFLILVLFLSVFTTVFWADWGDDTALRNAEAAEATANKTVATASNTLHETTQKYSGVISAKADLDAAKLNLENERKKLSTESRVSFNDAQSALNDAIAAYEKVWWETSYSEAQTALESAQQALAEARKVAEEKHKEACALSKSCLEDENFEITVSDFVPWWTFDPSKWSNMKERTNWILWTIIEKLVIALGILSVFIMTIWWAYMILHNWQDELLNKWKSIFMSGIYAMAIALSSYFMVAIVRYLVFN